MSGEYHDKRRKQVNDLADYEMRMMLTGVATVVDVMVAKYQTPTDMWHHGVLHGYEAVQGSIDSWFAVIAETRAEEGAA